MKISDVLWDAANKHLHSNLQYFVRNPRSQSSVGAVFLARAPGVLRHETVNFLCQLGVDPGDISTFHEFPLGPERQAARYNWLMFAYLIALEEGL